MKTKKTILALFSFLAVFAVSAVAFAQEADVAVAKAHAGGWIAIGAGLGRRHGQP